MHVEEEFLDICEDLEIQDKHRHLKWKEILEHGPRKKWLGLWKEPNPITASKETDKGFREAYFTRNTPPMRSLGTP